MNTERTYHIWDSESSLTLNNGKTYDKDFIKENFYISDDDKAILVIEDGKVIDITLLSVYINNFGLNPDDSIEFNFDKIKGELNGE